MTFSVKSHGVLLLLAVALSLTIAEARQNMEIPYMRREDKQARISAHQQPTLAQKATRSTAYYDAVIASNPQGYWTMQTETKVWGTESTSAERAVGEGEACGIAGWEAAGDICRINGRVFGSPSQVYGLISSKPGNKAMSFDGSDNEEVRVPDHGLINTMSTGYQERTVELWFQAEAPAGVQRVIYSEGNADHSGMSMYVSDDTEPTSDHMQLNMFAWDRGNHEREFGTATVLPEPISCRITEDTPYYVAMVFNAPNRSYTGWIKALNSNEAGMELCGQQDQLPAGARLTHTSGGKATFGGVHVSSRAKGQATEILCGESTDANCKAAGQGHGFIGVIDEVAIYDRILDNSELEQHFDAAPEAGGNNFLQEAESEDAHLEEA